MKDIDKLNELFETENKEKVIKSIEYNFYAIESMYATTLIDTNCLKEEDLNEKFNLLKEIFLNRFNDFDEMKDLIKNIKEDLKDEKKLIEMIKKGEECFSQEEMQTEITYKLKDNSFFQFHKSEDGFYFDLFDKEGNLQDGGVKLYRFFEIELDKLPKKYILKELYNMISPNSNLKNIVKTRLEDGLSEEDIKKLAISYKIEEKENYNKNLLQAVNLFMNENDDKGLKKLYKATNDELVKILIQWRDEYCELIDEYTSYPGSMYEDIFNYVWKKYKLSEIRSATEEYEKNDEEEEL